MDNELTERQRAVLAMIVSEYVTTAAPVGSDTIVRKYCPGVSAATVRNEMVTLAAAGYVYLPHTSAGRVPSAEGYRYYVRHLMQPAELSPDERFTIDHLFHQIERDLGLWMQLAATVLTQLTGNAAIVTLPRVRRSQLRHLQLIVTQERAALVVALLGEGTLHQKLLVQSEPLRQEELDRIAQRLNAVLRGFSADEIEGWAGAETSLERAVRDCLVDLMRRADQQAVPGVWYAGISSLLAQPEFSHGDKAQEILRAFEQPHLAVELADAMLEHPGVRVMIGDEVPWPILRECAIVGTRYGTGGSRGALAVIGPTRMRYERVIATIQYLGDVMTDLWAELCG
jgi:heat-inducible transcriptional repressor